MPMQLAHWVLLAAPNPSISWAIVLFFWLLGMLVTLSPSRRTYEIKKPRDD
jgi:uncharacterized protein (DUF58 family)